MAASRREGEVVHLVAYSLTDLSSASVTRRSLCRMAVATGFITAARPRIRAVCRQMASSRLDIYILQRHDQGEAEGSSLNPAQGDVRRNADASIWRPVISSCSLVSATRVRAETSR